MPIRSRINWKLLLGLCALIITLQAKFVLGDVPLELEADYALATLDYHNNKYDESLESIRGLLKRAPGSPELLELAALNLKALGRNREAIRVYERIVEGFEKRGARGEAGRYYFGLGVLQSEKGADALRARECFGRAIEAGYAEAHYLLGVMDFEEKEWVRARSHFESVTGAEEKDLALQSRFYLARISQELNDTNETIRQFLAVRSLAQAMSIEEGISPQALALADYASATTTKELRAFERSAFYASLGTTLSYDSNVLSVPTNETPGVVRNAPQSLIQSLQYSLSYPSSPLSPVQVIPTCGGAFNYVFNSEAKNSQFFSQSLGLYFTRDALTLTNFGFKAEVNGSFQYRDQVYKGYALFSSFGPYFKYEFQPKWVVGLDLFFQPKKFYVDSLYDASYARSGWDQWISFRVERADLRPSWNPALALSFDWGQTNGREFQSRRLALDFSNAFYPNRRLSLALASGASASLYPRRAAGTRTDYSVTLGASGAYQLGSQFAVVTSLRYYRNLSDTADFRSRRFVVSLGGNYLF